MLAADQEEAELARRHEDDHGTPRGAHARGKKYESLDDGPIFVEYYPDEPGPKKVLG